MRPSQLLAAKAEGNTVNVMAIGNGTSIYVAGSSLPINVAPLKDVSSVSSFSVVAKEGENGIVAIKVSFASGKSNDTVEFFLEVTSEDGKARINLEDSWFPKNDRLGNVDSYNTMYATIDGKWYCTDKNTAEKVGGIYFPDGKLLCKYLIGDVDAQAVIDAAEKAVEEKNALAELAELKKELKKVETERFDYYEQLLVAGGERNDLKFKVEKFQAQLEEVNKVFEDTRNKNASFAMIRDRMSVIASNLVNANDWKPWGKKKREKILLEIRRTHRGEW